MGTQEELELDKGSEAYAKLLAQEEREWHEQYDALIDRKIEIFASADAQCGKLRID